MNHGLVLFSLFAFMLLPAAGIAAQEGAEPAVAGTFSEIMLMAALAAVFWVPSLWAWRGILASGKSRKWKAAWFLACLFLGIIGAAIYFFIGRGQRRAAETGAGSGAPDEGPAAGLYAAAKESAQEDYSRREEPLVKRIVWPPGASPFGDEPYAERAGQRAVQKPRPVIEPEQRIYEPPRDEGEEPEEGLFSPVLETDASEFEKPKPKPARREPEAQVEEAEEGAEEERETRWQEDEGPGQEPQRQEPEAGEAPWEDKPREKARGYGQFGEGQQKAKPALTAEESADAGKLFSLLEPTAGRYNPDSIREAIVEKGYSSRVAEEVARRLYPGG